jgi:hypothetical protein
MAILRLSISEQCRDGEIVQVQPKAAGFFENSYCRKPCLSGGVALLPASRGAGRSKGSADALPPALLCFWKCVICPAELKTRTPA